MGSPSPTLPRSWLISQPGIPGFRLSQSQGCTSPAILPENAQLGHKGLWLSVCVTQHTSIRPPGKNKGKTPQGRQCHLWMKKCLSLHTPGHQKKGFHPSLENVRTGRASALYHLVWSLVEQPKKTRARQGQWGTCLQTIWLCQARSGQKCPCLRQEPWSWNGTASCSQHP